VVVLDHSACCFSCLCRAFPGWDDRRVADWLIRQAELAAAPRLVMEYGRQLELAIKEELI